MRFPGHLDATPASAGFTLLEVLVSIVVLSFGMLALAGLQATSLKVGREANLQAVAVQFAREYSEFLRNNPVVASEVSSSSNPYLISQTSTAPTSFSGTNCYTSTCTALQLATWEAYEWQARLFDALPSAYVAVCRDSTPYDSSGLAQWTCTSTSSNQQTLSIKIGWTQTVMSSGSAVLQAGSVRPSVVQTVLPGGAGS